MKDDCPLFLAVSTTMDSASLPLLSVVLHALVLLAPAAASDDPAVFPLKDICKKLEYPDLCVSSVQSIAPGLDSTDQRTALKHAVQALHDSIETAMSKAATIPSDQLGTCAEGLNDAKDDTEEAQNALEVDDEGTMKANLDAVVSGINNCREDMSMTPPTTPPAKLPPMPMKAEADGILQLLKNCWDLYYLIWP